VKQRVLEDAEGRTALYARLQYALQARRIPGRARRGYVGTSDTLGTSGALRREFEALTA